MTSLPEPIAGSATNSAPRRRPRQFEKTSPLVTAAFLLPAALLLLVFLVYPMLYTLRLSVDRGLGGNLTRFVGIDNYVNLFNDSTFIQAIVNNVLWIVFYTGFVIGLGLIVAVIAM